jgi:hypothetical protein
LSAVIAQGNLTAASFGAIAPDAGAATFTVTWGATCQRRIALGDEFSGAASDARAFDAHVAASGSGACATTITTASADDAVWAACYSTAGVTAPGAGFAKGADDAFGDWTEYALAADRAGTPIDVTFAVSAPTFIVTAATIRPR